MNHTPYPNLQKLFLGTATFVLIVSALYLARSVLIPITFAVLLCFILSPLVSFFQKRGMGRLPAVIVVMLLLLVVIVAVFATFFAQIRSLAIELPQYKQEIVAKIKTVRDGAEGNWIGNFIDSFRDINKTVKDEQTPKEGEPVAVKNVTDDFPFVNTVAGGTLNFAVDAGLVLLLVIFMLIQREDWRNRVIRLWGDKNLTLSTKALDDASTRISKYLLMQLVVNSSYGLILAIGLWFIDVPYAFIWGFLAFLLRYIPYIGPWVAAIFPLVSAWALLDGWTPFFLTLGFIVVLELVSNNLMEPMLYRRSTGVSELALLIAAAFWTWLWGPLGLVLATPLTVCLVVFGRYVPGLEFFHVLLGDQPVLEPHVTFYQRLLAHDLDEAVDHLEAYVTKHKVTPIYDEVLVPALVLAGKDRERGELTPEDHQVVLQETREVLEEAVYPVHVALWKEHEKENSAPSPHRALVYGIACRDDSDEILLEMFKEYVGPGKCDFNIISPKTLLGELLTKMQDEPPEVIVIGALPLRRSAHTRYLCKKIRKALPDLPIFVGCWGLQGDTTEVAKKMEEAGATKIGVTFKETADQMAPLLQVANAQEEALVV